MKKFKKPKSIRLGLEQRVRLIHELVSAADKDRNYLIGRVAFLEKLSKSQDEALGLFYETLVEMATPRHVKLWRWVKGKVR